MKSIAHWPAAVIRHYDERPAISGELNQSLRILPIHFVVENASVKL